jgi:hypothetical protein
MSSVGAKLADITRVTGISGTVTGWYCYRPDTGELERGNMSKEWRETESQKKKNILTK